jgi:hypothetical protein
MTLLVPFARTAFPIAIALAIASACGGQSFQGHGGEAGEAGTGSTNNLSGGSGGSASAGTSSGGTGFDEACGVPSSTLEPGGCTAAFPRWYHDPATGICRPFIYGGCGGTKNNYETLESCQQACPGRAPSYDACKVATDCVLASGGCCGVCDGPEVSAHDFLAYNRAYAAQFPQCDVLCGACPEPVPGQGMLQYFIPNCIAGECVVQDIRDATACATADDCRLRHGIGCCEGCGGDGLIAVRNDGSFEKLVCGELIPPCDPCAAPTPDGAFAFCDVGHCQLGYVLK